MMPPRSHVGVLAILLLLLLFLFTPSAVHSQSCTSNAQCQVPQQSCSFTAACPNLSIVSQFILDTIAEELNSQCVTSTNWVLQSTNPNVYVCAQNYTGVNCTYVSPLYTNNLVPCNNIVNAISISLASIVGQCLCKPGYQNTTSASGVFIGCLQIQANGTLGNEATGTATQQLASSTPTCSASSWGLLPCVAPAYLIKNNNWNVNQVNCTNLDNVGFLRYCVPSADVANAQQGLTLPGCFPNLLACATSGSAPPTACLILPTNTTSLITYPTLAACEQAQGVVACTGGYACGPNAVLQGAAFCITSSSVTAESNVNCVASIGLATNTRICMCASSASRLLASSALVVILFLFGLLSLS